MDDRTPRLHRLAEWLLDRFLLFFFASMYYLKCAQVSELRGEPINLIDRVGFIGFGSFLILTLVTMLCVGLRWAVGKLPWRIVRRRGP